MAILQSFHCWRQPILRKAEFLVLLAQRFDARTQVLFDYLDAAGDHSLAYLEDEVVLNQL